MPNFFNLKKYKLKNQKFRHETDHHEQKSKTVPPTLLLAGL